MDTHTQTHDIEVESSLSVQLRRQETEEDMWENTFKVHLTGIFGFKTQANIFYMF